MIGTDAIRRRAGRTSWAPIDTRAVPGHTGAMTGDRASLLRRSGAWLALVGMLVVLVLPLIPRPALASALGVEGTVICTPYGIKVVDGSQADSSVPDQAGGGVHCPLCIGPGGGWILPTPLPMPFRLPLVSTRLIAFFADIDPVPAIDTARSPNAPRPPPAL